MRTIKSKEDGNVLSAKSAKKKPSNYLSKSLYIRGLQCHKSLYLEKFHRDLKEETAAEAQERFDIGNMVGESARGLFPDGVLVPYIETENGVAEQLRLTSEAMKKGSKVIYEASFQYDGIFVKVDILHKGSRGWEIYEVKAGTKLDPVYVDDAALQYYILTGAGIKVGKAFISHINGGYVRKGALDVQKLFTSEDITKQVKEKQLFVIEQLKKQRRMLKGKLPKIDIGPHCSDPYECDFCDHCWKHIPDDSVFDLYGKGVNPFDLYAQAIIKQKDIPLDLLNRAQRQQVVATAKKQNAVDKKKIREFLKTLSYPLYFLDFETFMSAIPLYDGVKPYQQVPFQYSLHYQNKKGGKLYHTEFLANSGIDPRKPLLEKMLTEIPDDVCILTYNMTFEKRVLTELSTQFPKHKKAIEKWTDNMQDLMVPFRQRDVYFWKFKGSYSIKNVLPVLVPQLSYEDLEIADGGAAMDAYHQMGAAKDNPEELAKIRENLLAYCKLDTLAMVRILETLGELI
ncbi:MAG: DUF2779 domain-containing protein [Proteobacteria bacterium]|nr:DUF2779 domain-containing protein [Pseudomonadota bacterium]MBU4581165.1 DUF2779 domain-containing protein [Pseudomonadota bacterium]MCG2740583.1 DUF2779 domain-containing protein [Syntrophaceae bacterium]